MARDRAGRPGRGISRPGALIVLLLLIAAGAVWWIAHQRAGTVEVYFVRPDSAHHTASLAAVRRPAPRGPVEARADAALRNLLAGPDKEGRGGEGGLISEIPAGTALLGVQVNAGIMTVNLSKIYAAGGGSTSMLARVWQVVYTATQFPDVQAAQILVEGRRDEALGGEGVMIGAPLRRPAAPPSF
jgi:spore germination protein GerM